MYAIIKTGGKQYRVEEGQYLTVEKIANALGSTVDFNDVLMVGSEGNVKIGSPFVSNAKVQAEIVNHDRGKKINIIKLKRRKHHMKHAGHRQDLTKVKIVKIED